MRGKKSGALAGAGVDKPISEFARSRMTREERLYAMMLEPAKATRFETTPTEARWFCFSVAGGADFTIEGKLSTAGVEVFVLREQRETIKKGVKIVSERPVFGGYVFVRMLPIAAAFHAIKQVKGVVDFIGDGVRYTEIPEKQMVVFKRVFEAVNVERMPVDRSIAQGQRAYITHGLFAGSNCVVVRVKSGRNPRVNVCVEGYGEFAHDVEIDLAFLQKL